MFEFNLIIICAGSIVLIGYVSSKVWKKLFYIRKDNKNSLLIRIIYHLRSYIGDANSQFELGSIYHQGKGVIPNYHKALKFYKLASDKGHYKAFNNMGMMYAYGSGGERDLDKALKLVKMSINKHYDIIAMISLGNIHWLRSDYEQAYDYYKICA